MECCGNRSGVLELTPLKCSQYTLMGINSSCMHRNLMIQRKLIFIKYTTTVDDFNKKLTINTIIQQNSLGPIRRSSSRSPGVFLCMLRTLNKRRKYIMVRFQYETCLT